MTSHILLLGAGFSRNWGGWLANEALEYLLGCSLCSNVRARLLDRGNGGFVGALGALQQDWHQRQNAEARTALSELEGALELMFKDMNNGFLNRPFEFSTDHNYSIANFLARFDAIFTLNQDIWLEYHYLPRETEAYAPKKWHRVHFPGIQAPERIGPNDIPSIRDCVPRQDLDLGLRSDFQPIFKLHGSSNWRSGSENLLVMGANKAGTINSFPLLKQYHDIFKKTVSEADTRLMVIGYSFGDEHVNSVIEQSAQAGALKTFIIDPAGLDVLDRYRNRPTQIRVIHALEEAIRASCIGGSRRSLREIFGSDPIEFQKVMKFFAT